MAGVDDAFNIAETGASFIPGPGTAIAAGLGIGKGVFDLIKGNREQKKAMGLTPPMEDPEMRQYLGYLQRKQRAIETGTAYGRQTAEIGSQLANTQAGITQASGGNAGAAILGMNRAQRGAGDAYGNLVEKNAPLAAAYEGDIGKVLQDMSDRRLNLQNYAHEQALGESAILRKSGEEAIMGGVANLLPMALPGRRRKSVTGVPLDPNALPSASASAAPVPSVDWSNPYGATRDYSTGTVPLENNLLPVRRSSIPMESYGN